MKRFLIAAAFAVALGLGTSNKAHAQIVYGFSAPIYGGMETSTTTFTPFGSQTFTNFFSPFNGNTQTAGIVNTPFGGQTFTNSFSPFNGTSQSMATFNNPFARQMFANSFSPFTGNIQTAGVFGSPFGSQSFSNSFSPSNGMRGQTSNTNMSGATSTRTVGFNPMTGTSFGGGSFSQPNSFMMPFVNSGRMRR